MRILAARHNETTKERPCRLFFLPSSAFPARRIHPLKVEWPLIVLRDHPVTAVTEREVSSQADVTRRWTAGRTGLGPMTSREIGQSLGSYTRPLGASPRRDRRTGNIIARARARESLARNERTGGSLTSSRARGPPLLLPRFTIRATCE